MTGVFQTELKFHGMVSLNPQLLADTVKGKKQAPQYVASGMLSEETIARLSFGLAGWSMVNISQSPLLWAKCFLGDIHFYFLDG